MGKSEKLDMEENMIDENVKSRSKKGYFVTKQMIVLALIVIVLILIIVALLAAYFGPGRDRHQGRDSLSTSPPIVTQVPTTVGKPTTTVSGNVPYANIRLPKTVIPNDYKVFLSVDMTEQDVSGTVNVTITVTAPTKYFIIHGKDYIRLKGVLKDDKNVEIAVKREFLYAPNEYHILELENEVPAGMYQLDYYFQYHLKTTLKGFYGANYTTESGAKKLVAATQFEPVDARTAFPCFDEPAMKANFTLTIAHTEGFFALSNMPVKNQWIKAGYVYNEFRTSPKMPTYLVAFVICDFANKTITANTTIPVEMTYYAPKEQINQIDYAMKVGSKILSFFETYYNVSYPLPKADMIAIPDFSAGAMENWGLITYRARALLFDNQASSVSNKQYVAAVVSHELAHQWFGNIVTMEWWSDLWLNEGFASYVEYLGMNATEPSWNVLDYQVVSDVATGLALDALVTSHPVYIEVNHPDEINEIFDAISYQKGGSVLRMLDDLLGNGVFVKGLNIYLNKYSYGNARTNDLWDALSEASRLYGDSKNVSAIMNTWILQMGFPVVNVAANKDSSFALTQSRFLRDPKPDLTKTNFTSPYNYTWVIPFNYMVLNISDVKNVNIVTDKNLLMMNMAGGKIDSTKSMKDLIIKGNAGQYGFFRVNYDSNGWNNILKVLQNNHKVFDVKDRAGLIADSFALAMSARLDYSVALDIFDYIDQDEDYIPWKAAVDSISFIPKLLTSTRPAQKEYSKYMLKKITPLYEKYAFKETSDHLERYLQTLVVSVACGAGHAQCLSNATKLFKDFMKDPDKNPVPSDFRSLVYYYGVYNGGEEEWDFLFNRYRTNKIASEKTKLMYGMSAVQEPWMLTRWLNYGLNESIVKSQDVSYVFSYVSNSNPIGRYAAWNFMKENWLTIQTRFAKSFFAIKRIFSSVVSGFTAQYELDQLLDFVNNKVSNPGTAKRAMAQSEEKIRANIEWLQRNEDNIEQWLSKKNKAL